MREHVLGGEQAVEGGREAGIDRHLHASRLMTRMLVAFEHRVVGSSGYFERLGRPQTPEDLRGHACLQHRFPSTGKFERWPRYRGETFVENDLPSTLSASTLEPLIYLAEQ